MTYSFVIKISDFSLFTIDHSSAMQSHILALIVSLLTLCLQKLFPPMHFRCENKGSNWNFITQCKLFYHLLSKQIKIFQIKMNNYVVSNFSLALYQFIYIVCECGAICCLVSGISIHIILNCFLFFCRDCKSNDACDQPGDVHVLGDVPVVCYGNNG